MTKQDKATEIYQAFADGLKIQVEQEGKALEIEAVKFDGVKIWGYSKSPQASTDGKEGFRKLDITELPTWSFQKKLIGAGTSEETQPA